MDLNLTIDNIIDSVSLTVNGIYADGINIKIQVNQLKGKEQFKYQNDSVSNNNQDEIADFPFE